MADDAPQIAAETATPVAAPALPAPIAPREPMPKAIAMALLEIMRGIKKLENSETNVHAKYRFVSIDQYYELVRPLMVDAGLLILPEEIKVSFNTTESTNDNGSVKLRTFLSIRYAFTLIHADSGAEWTHRPERAAMVDAAMGPQGFGAAQSYAEKVFLRGLFKMATGEADTDGADMEQGSIAPVSGRQALGMGQDNKPRTQNRQLERDGFPPDRQQGQRQPAQQSRQGQGQGKNASQARKDGDWDKIRDGMALQRTEEELVAWGKANGGLIQKLPKSWQEQARELYAKELERVRDLDNRRAERDADTRYDPRTGQLIEDEYTEEEDGAGDHDASGDFPGDRPPLGEGHVDTGRPGEPFNDKAPF